MLPRRKCCEGFAMLKASRSRKKSVHARMRSVVAGLLAILLMACQNAAAPAPSLPPTLTLIAFVPLDVLLKSGGAAPVRSDNRWLSGCR